MAQVLLYKNEGENGRRGEWEIRGFQDPIFVRPQDCRTVRPQDYYNQISLCW